MQKVVGSNPISRSRQCPEEAMEAIPLEPVDSLTVTTLVDNVTDSLLVDQGPPGGPR